ncbi:hypothetical protein, partial [Streptomyces malaysiensis]|uniref:hypothetical protein n=1 Tax=Streptomyces malaysiensis TaxID=92644 RepID=UPI00404802D2
MRRLVVGWALALVILAPSVLMASSMPRVSAALPVSAARTATLPAVPLPAARAAAAGPGAAGPGPAGSGAAGS